MNDAGQNPSEPFHGWSPFGLLPVLTWPAWACPHLPEHFRRRGAARGSAVGPCPDSGKIVDLEDYRRRLAQLRAAPGGSPATLRKRRPIKGDGELSQPLEG